MRNTTKFFDPQAPRFDWRRILRDLCAPLIAPVFILIAVADIHYQEQMAPTVERVRDAARPLLSRLAGPLP